MSLSEVKLTGPPPAGKPLHADASPKMYLDLVDAALASFFAASRRRALTLSPRFARLWEALEDSADGGKRFRPQLLFTTWHGLGGADVQAAAQVGAAFELLHTALIVHDDVVDRDFVRRGRPNVAGRYLDAALAQGLPRHEAEHRALSVGVVAGDVALFNAYRFIDDANVPAPLRSRLVSLLDEAVLASAAGELLDIEYSLSGTGPAVDDIVNMERLKTAVYSFEGPLMAGAVLAGASEPTIARLGEVGRCMGIAYQIVDDVLGVFGQETGTGKSVLGDIREGKWTVLMAHAATTPSWPAIRAHLGDPDLSLSQAAEVRAMLTAAGSRAYAENLASKFAEDARSRLADPQIPQTLQGSLDRLLTPMLHRSR